MVSNYEDMLWEAAQLALALKLLVVAYCSSWALSSF